MKIIVTGGTGFIGRALVDQLSEQERQVVVLTRQAPHHPPKAGVRFMEWDGASNGPWQAEVASADAVINLAGEPIADARWTSARKRLLIDSRVRCTRRIVDALSGRSATRPVLISASGIGYYGASDDRPLDEHAAAGQGFLADLSSAWEAEALRGGQFGARAVLLRTGMVLEQDSPVGSHRPYPMGHRDAGDLGSPECGGARGGDDEDLLCHDREGPPSSVVDSRARPGVTSGAG